MAGMSRLRLPELWFRALFAGLESAVLSWLVAMVPSLVTYVATAAAPGLGDASWQSAAGVAAAWWRTGFGGTFPAGEAGVVSLIPLALPLVTVLLLRGSIRRAGLHTIAESAFAVGGFLALTVVLTIPGEGPGRELLGLVAAGVAGVVTALWGRTLELPARIRLWLDGLPREIGRGFGDGRKLAWWVVGLGAAVVLGGLALSWSSVAEIHSSLGPDSVSSGVMALLQFMYLPNLALWALAWLAGPGFMVGEGTHFASTGVTTEALPAIPVLGALPSPGNEPGWWVALVLVALGALVAWLRSRGSVPPRDWTACGQRVGAAAGTVLAVMLVLAWLAGGSIGPGRMAVLGVSPLVVSLAVSAEVIAGYAAVVLARHALALRNERLAGGGGGVGAGDDGDGAGEGAGDGSGEADDAVGGAGEADGAVGGDGVRAGVSSPGDGLTTARCATPRAPDGAPTAATAAVAPTAATAAVAPTAATAAVAPTAATAAVAPTAATAADTHDGA